MKELEKFCIQTKLDNMEFRNSNSTNITHNNEKRISNTPILPYKRGSIKS